MDTFTIILMLATFIHGLGAGLCFDVSLVKLPTRHRIGIIPYANFARGNDLGNGIIVYPIIGGSGLLIIFATTILAYIREQPSSILYPLYISTLATILASFGTAKAAPIMLNLKNTPNDEQLLKQKLDRFARWHNFRTIFQMITFIALIWTLATL
jgi:hypothetical protein